MKKVLLGGSVIAGVIAGALIIWKFILPLISTVFRGVLSFIN